MSAVWQDSETWSYNPHAGNVLSERFKGKRFDSYFGKSSHPTQNHSLRLYLRVNLKQVNSKTNTLDFNKESFPIKDWSPDEWYRFATDFERQSRLWNNRFWLIPPTYFTLLDVKNGGRAVRPNIHCHLMTEVANSASNAHRTIEVVNLDIPAVKKQKGIDNPGSGTFRSDDKHYDSLDIKPRNNHYTDNDDVEHTIKNYYTIAHEIGHAIGLGHIGVLKSTSKCLIAIYLKSKGITRDVADRYKNGSNSPVCYGRFDYPNVAENIMGLGTKFEEVNAQPWVNRVAMHTNTLARDWKVSLIRTPPKAVS
jgi:hypothetical protein